MKTYYAAEVFQNGENQTIFLPKALHFQKAVEVYIWQEGDKLVITSQKPSWEAFFATPSVFGDDFLSKRDDTFPQERAID